MTKCYIAKNVSNLSLLNCTDENKNKGLVAVIDCYIKENCVSLISYLDKSADSLEFHSETESVMKYLKESNTFNLLNNRDEMTRICGFCPDFEIIDKENHYAFMINGELYNYYIDCDLNSYSANVYVYLN